MPDAALRSARQTEAVDGKCDVYAHKAVSQPAILQIYTMQQRLSSERILADHTASRIHSLVVT